MNKFRYLVPLAAALIGLPHVYAQEVRQLNRIATPSTAQKLPPGTRTGASQQPVSAARVEEAVKKIAAAWNTPNLAPMLADSFYDKSRLVDALSTKVPRDARLRVLSVQGIQTLNQYLQKSASGMEQRISRVSVTVRTQLEYNDPQAGFQRLDGTNEFILLIAEPSS